MKLINGFIEKGKKYINTELEEVKIVRFDDGYKFPFTDEDGNQYSKRGEMPGRQGKDLIYETR